MQKLLKILLKLVFKLFKILLGAAVILFIVYFLNLDQKLLGWAYKRVNEIFDRKKVDIVF